MWGEGNDFSIHLIFLTRIMINAEGKSFHFLSHLFYVLHHVKIFLLFPLTEFSQWKHFISLYSTVLIHLENKSSWRVVEKRVCVYMRNIHILSVFEEIYLWRTLRQHTHIIIYALFWFRTDKQFELCGRQPNLAQSVKLIFLRLSQSLSTDENFLTCKEDKQFAEHWKFISMSCYLSLFIWRRKLLDLQRTFLDFQIEQLQQSLQREVTWMTGTNILRACNSCFVREILSFLRLTQIQHQKYSTDNVGAAKENSSEHCKHPN